MRKLITTIICAAIIAITGIVLFGCSNDSFYKLNKQFNALSETTESIDDVNKDDLTIMSEESLSKTINEEVVLSAGSVISNPELLQKVSNVLATREEIKTKTDEIEILKSDLKAIIVEIKATIKDLRAEKAELSEEERVIIDEYITEIQSIIVTLQDTIGKAYKRMHDLRGSYNLSNIDTIETTFSEVNDVLAIRINSLTRLGEIAVEINTMLGAKTSN